MANTVRIVSWNPTNAINLIGLEMERRLERAALLVERTAIQKISRGQPVRRLPGGRLVGLSPSLPGEPPKVLYGRLRQSIGHIVRRVGNVVVALVGSNVVYARALELGRPPNLAARPYLRPSLDENQAEIAAILGEGG